ncbi:MAG: AMP-binding protein [Burkholderiales bacterium]|nr:AMP-binding protein [Burkholderiales bacterium]
MNVAVLLARAALAHPHAPALAHGERVVADYAAASERIARLSGGLIALGVEPGDRVALVMKNHPAYWEALFATWHAGLTAVPIHSKLHPKELAFIFENCGAPVVIASDNTQSACEEAAGMCPGVRHVIGIESTAFARLAAAPPLPLVPRAPDDLAWLFYTSGTTGRPKGVMLSHANLLAMTLNYFSDVDAIAREDCIVHAAPMSHGSGIYILPHVARGACNVVAESGGFDAGEIFRLWRRHGQVTMFAAPTMVKRLTEAREDADPAGLKTIVYGGGPMYVADIQAAILRFGQRFAQIYGQGESPMTITASDKAVHRDSAHPRYLERLGSVGRAFTGVEVMVAGEDDRALPLGEIGEICVRGSVVMQGYWKNPEASSKALANGWLHTGDVGALDHEGFLTLKDRSKDLIISGGSNIYPREVEEALLTHPGVAEVSVVGRAHPEWGEEVVAFVVRRPQAPPSAAELDDHVVANIARFKRPKQYRFVDALPKNETGKVLKTALRSLL